MYRTVYIRVEPPPVSLGQNVSPEPCQSISPGPPRPGSVLLSCVLQPLILHIAGAPAEPEEVEGSGSGYSGPPASNTKPWRPQETGAPRPWQQGYTRPWSPRPRPWSPWSPPQRQWRGPMGHVVPSFSGPQPAWQPPPVVQQVRYNSHLTVSWIFLLAPFD